VSAAQSDHPGLLDRKASQDHRDRQALKGTTGMTAATPWMGKTALRESLAPPATQDQRDRKDHAANRARPASPDRKAAQDLRASKGRAENRGRRQRR
jgi:hypothetical protein